MHLFIKWMKKLLTICLVHPQTKISHTGQHILIHLTIQTLKEEERKRDLIHVNVISYDKNVFFY